MQFEGRPTPRKSFWPVVGQICNAHAQKVLFPSFRSKC